MNLYHLLTVSINSKLTSLVSQIVKNLYFGRPGFATRVGKIPWRREWQPTPVFLPENFHGQRSLVGYNSWGHKDMDKTEWLTLSLSFTVKNIFSWWNSNTLATSCEELTHWKRLWCWEGLGAGGEGDDRGWDGWMASPTWWTWVWVNSGSWWWTGRPGVLRFMGSQRVGHDWATELNWTETITGEVSS